MAEMIQTKKVLLKFPASFSLKEATSIVKMWKHVNPYSVKSGYVDGELFVYAEGKVNDEGKMATLSQRIERLYAQGMRVHPRTFIPEFDREYEGERPVNNNVNTPPVNIPPTQFGDIDIIKDILTRLDKSKIIGEVKEIKEEVKEIKELIKQLLNKKESVTMVERGGSAKRVSDRDMATSTSVPLEKEAPLAKNRRASAGGHVKPTIDSDDEPLSGAIEYYNFKKYPNTFRKIGGIAQQRETSFWVSMGRGMKQYFKVSDYGSTGKAYEAAKAFLNAKTSEGGFNTNRTEAEKWLNAYHDSNDIKIKKYDKTKE